MFEHTELIIRTIIMIILNQSWFIINIVTIVLFFTHWNVKRVITTFDRLHFLLKWCRQSVFLLALIFYLLLQTIMIAHWSLHDSHFSDVQNACIIKYPQRRFSLSVILTKGAVWQIEVAARGYVVVAVDVDVKVLFWEAVVSCRCCEVVFKKLKLDEKCVQECFQRKEGKKTGCDETKLGITQEEVYV